jgi:hypothetical protein
MMCSGHYDPKDKLCWLCGEVNTKVSVDCQRKANESLRAKADEAVIDFLVSHCKYCIREHADYEDYIACTVNPDDEGYYDKCSSFGEQCALGGKQ